MKNSWLLEISEKIVKFVKFFFGVRSFVSYKQKSNRCQGVSTDSSTSKYILLPTIHLALITLALNANSGCHFELQVNIIAIFSSNQNGMIAQWTKSKIRRAFTIFVKQNTLYLPKIFREMSNESGEQQK